MKIAVVATPRSGNHWLRSLLSEIYSLPLLEPEDWPSSESWVGHEHLWPDRKTLAWLEQNDITPVTILRHPFDILVSLYHFVRTKHRRISNEWLLQGDTDGIGSGTLHFVKSEYYSLLLISELWRKAGTPFVRFEDLISDPVPALRTITRSIEPVDDDKIHRAILCSEFSVLRDTGLKDDQDLYRSGRSGNGGELTPEIISTLSSGPFAELLTAQGYKSPMEPVMPFDITPLDPFQGHRSFTNGIPISARFYNLLIRIPDLTARWPCPWVATGDDSLYYWLNQQCQDYPFTNLTMLVHSRRPDVAEPYPLDGPKDDIAIWFLACASSDYDFGPEFVQPVFELLQQSSSREKTISPQPVAAPEPQAVH